MGINSSAPTTRKPEVGSLSEKPQGGKTKTFNPPKTQAFVETEICGCPEYQPMAETQKPFSSRISLGGGSYPNSQGVSSGPVLRKGQIWLGEYSTTWKGRGTLRAWRYRLLGATRLRRAITASRPRPPCPKRAKGTSSLMGRVRVSGGVPGALNLARRDRCPNRGTPNTPRFYPWGIGCGSRAGNPYGVGVGRGFTA